MRLTLSLFGPPRIVLDGAPVALETRKAVALLAYVAATGRPSSRDALVALLWPELDQSRGRAVLRRTLYAINKTPLAFWLDARRDLVALRHEPGLDIDILRFRGLIAEASRIEQAEGGCSDRAISLLVEAVSLYEDDFLSGFSLGGSLSFDDWQSLEAESMRGELAGALQRLARAYGERQQLEAAIRAARRWVLLDVLNERARAVLMSVLAAAGRRAEALQQYDECARLLRKELGAAPGGGLTGLRDAIRAGRAAARPGEAPGT